MIVLNSYILENNFTVLDVCVANGPAPTFSFTDNLDPVFYLSDGSCGEVLDTTPDYAKIKAYFPAFNGERSYWVPRSQLYISFKNFWE